MKLPYILDKLLIVLSVIISPLTLFVLIFFWIYRQLVKVYCQFKYGNSFGGFSDIGDNVWANEDSSKMLINTLIFISSKDGDPECIKTVILEHLKLKVHDKAFAKLSSIRTRELGYMCMLKDSYSPEEAVELLKFDKSKTSITKDELEDIVSEYSNKPLPKNNTCFYHILISSLPVSLDHNNGNKQYPILCRFHHTLSDGPSLAYNFFDAINMRDQTKNVESLTKKSNENSSLLPKILCYLYCLLFSFHQLLTEVILHADEDCLLYGKELSGDKITIWYTEDKPILVKTLKKLRKIVPGSSFGDFILCAISASTYEYFEMKGLKSPIDISAVLPLGVPDSTTQLNNTFTLGIYQLPIIIDNNNVSPTKRLEKILSRTKMLRDSLSLMINYWIITYVIGLIPLPILSVLAPSNYTMGISNLPGPPKAVFSQNYSMEDVIFWVPHRGKNGVGISVYSYGEKLQIGLIVDKVLIQTKQDARFLLNGVIKNLRILSESVVE